MAGSTDATGTPSLSSPRRLKASFSVSPDPGLSAPHGQSSDFQAQDEYGPERPSPPCPPVALASPYLSSGEGTAVARDGAPGVDPGWDTAAGKGQNVNVRWGPARGDGSSGTSDQFCSSETSRDPLGESGRRDSPQKALGQELWPKPSPLHGAEQDTPGEPF